MERITSTVCFSILMISVTIVFSDRNDIRCGFIEIIGDKKDPSQYKNCTHANAIRIVNTSLHNLTFLDNIRRIDFNFKDPDSAREGAAVIIMYNEYIFLQDMLPSLTMIKYKGPRQHHLGFIIMHNNKCTNASTASRLEGISGGRTHVQITKCYCTYSELIEPGTSCEGLEMPQLRINSSNSKNWHLLQSLSKIKRINGSLIVSNTELDNLDFLNNLEEIKNWKPDRFLVHIHNNRLLKSVKFTNLPRNLTSYHGICYKLIKTRNNPLLNRSDLYKRISNALPIKDCIDFKTKERKNFFLNDEYVSIQDNVCTYDRLVFGKNPQLTSGELGTCSILTGREIIIDQDFDLAQWGPVLSRVRLIRSCVIIENTTLKSLSFLSNLEEISHCHHEEFLRIYNNSHLQNLQLGVIFCPKMRKNFRPTVTIGQNEVLCYRKIIEFKNQTKLGCGYNISYNIHIPRNTSLCDERLYKHHLDSFWYYIAASVTFFTLIATLFAIHYIVFKNKMKVKVPKVQIGWTLEPQSIRF